MSTNVPRLPRGINAQRYLALENTRDALLTGKSRYAAIPAEPFMVDPDKLVPASFSSALGSLRRGEWYFAAEGVQAPPGEYLLVSAAQYGKLMRKLEELDFLEEKVFAGEAHLWDHNDELFDQLRERLGPERAARYGVDTNWLRALEREHDEAMRLDKENVDAQAKASIAQDRISQQNAKADRGRLKRVVGWSLLLMASWAFFWPGFLYAGYRLTKFLVTRELDERSLARADETERRLNDAPRVLAREKRELESLARSMLGVVRPAGSREPIRVVVPETGVDIDPGGGSPAPHPGSGGVATMVRQGERTAVRGDIKTAAQDSIDMLMAEVRWRIMEDLRPALDVLMEERRNPGLDWDSIWRLGPAPPNIRDAAFDELDLSEAKQRLATHLVVQEAPRAEMARLGFSAGCIERAVQAIPSLGRRPAGREMGIGRTH